MRRKNRTQLDIFQRILSTFNDSDRDPKNHEFHTNHHTRECAECKRPFFTASNRRMYCWEHARGGYAFFEELGKDDIDAIAQMVSHYYGHDTYLRFLYEHNDEPLKIKGRRYTMSITRNIPGKEE